MPFFPIFLSLIIVVRNQSVDIKKILQDVTSSIGPLVSNYEIIIIDNASEDNSVATLRMLTDKNGFPNLQVFALTKEVDLDTATWIGLENSLGDFIVVFNPLVENIEFLSEMLEKSSGGFDIVFAFNQYRPVSTFTYRFCSIVFNQVYKYFSGINLHKDTSQYRLLSRRVVNFILQHPQPAITYRHLPATSGFLKIKLNYTAEKQPMLSNARLGESIDRGMRLLVSTTRAPMRLVTSLSLFGAVANLLYSCYVIAVAFLKVDVAPGWISISLQQSGMFFLISLVLLVLGEYILNMVNLQNEGPPYHVGQEFTSARMTRHEKLNIDMALSKLDNPSSDTERDV
jgi:glycosyltransferase involved in cell wall biosynthesis